MALYTAPPTLRGAARMSVLAPVLAWAFWFPTPCRAVQPTSYGVAPEQRCPTTPGVACGQHTNEADSRSEGRDPSSSRPAIGLVSVGERSASSEVQDALLPLWNQLAGRVGWQMLVSPAFPRDWPPAPPGRTAVVRYAFAMRLPSGVADGAEMAAPWARATLDANGGLVVEVLSPYLQPLGIQGVRPLRPGEDALVSREQEVSERLLAGSGVATDKLVRDFTCNWISRQGVVAASIMPLHPNFTHWLACTTKP